MQCLGVRNKCCTNLVKTCYIMTAALSANGCQQELPNMQKLCMFCRVRQELEIWCWAAYETCNTKFLAVLIEPLLGDLSSSFYQHLLSEFIMWLVLLSGWEIRSIPASALVILCEYQLLSIIIMIRVLCDLLMNYINRNCTWPISEWYVIVNIMR